MFRSFRTAFLLLLALSVSGLASAAEWKEGTHYNRLDNPVRTESDSGVEVAEVFWYGCPHCYRFKPLVEEWAASAPDYVNYVKIPAALGRNWEPHAYAFYALEAMGELDKVHDALFDALAANEGAISSAIEAEDFAAAMGGMAALRAPIDAFFEAVQVNSDKEIVRRNRLNLLHQIRAVCGQVADLTRLEG